MKRHIGALIALFSLVNLNAQTLSIEETIKYINDKLYSNPFVGYGGVSYYSSISVTKQGMLYVLSYKDKKLDYTDEIFIKHVDLIHSFEKCPDDKYDNVRLYCKLINEESDYFTNSNKCVKRARIIQGDVLYANYTFAMFGNPHVVGEGLCNAFQHLLNSVLTDPNYFPSDPNDPFAKKTVTNKTGQISTGNNTNTIKMEKKHGVMTIPVVLNSVLKIDFIYDSGASDVSISPDVALTLIKTGTLKQEDFIGTQKYSFADGSSATSKVFIIKEMQIGNQTISNIQASISNNINAPMLLGQSVLKKFGRIIIDNNLGTLTIEK